MAHVPYLTAMGTQTTDERLKALLQVIQLALFGSDLSQLGHNLSGVYREAWEAIVIGVEAEGVDPRLFAMIVQNTLAVLGSSTEKRSKWRDTLVQLQSQAAENDSDRLIALLNAVIGLLDADGNPAGLGKNLTGIYANVIGLLLLLYVQLIHNSQHLLVEYQGLLQLPCIIKDIRHIIERGCFSLAMMYFPHQW